MTHHSDKEHFLRRTLRHNAIFAAVLGAALFLAARPIADLLDLTSALGVALGLVVVFGAGLFLGVHALGLAALSRRPVIDAWRAAIAVGVSAVWALTSLAILLAARGTLVDGGWLVALVAEVMGVFAFLEVVGLWRALSNRRPGDGQLESRTA